jgi:hypothetical protein
MKKKYTARNKINKNLNTKLNKKINNNKKTKKSSNLCAPFIKPLNLSSNTGLTKANMNIIKAATDESCFTIEALRNIAEKWNTTHPEMKIDFDTTTSGKSLWQSINSVMSAKCTNEICWVKQPFIKDTPLAKELLKNFKPIMPQEWEANPYEWLNTLDIQKVMNQYETKHPDFEFIGPVPMDFDTNMGFGQCVVNELCKINLKAQLDKGKRKIGVVFNLDKHNQTGSHWVAMYFCYDDGHCCYWDSYGIKPNPEVVTLMNRLKDQSHGMGKTITLKINDVRHQYKNSECGVYCIYFLTSLLEGHRFENIIKKIVSDDKMNDKRKEFFAKV